MLVSNRVYHFTLVLNLLHLYRICFAKGLGCVHLICYVQGIVLPQPGYRSRLNPSRRFRLHFFGSVILHLSVSIEFLHAFETFELFTARYNDDPALLVYIEK